MTLNNIFKDMDSIIVDFYKAPYTKPKEEIGLQKKYYNVKETIVAKHDTLSDRALAFYQGAAWALASLDEDLEQDYIILCETVDERLK